MLDAYQKAPLLLHAEKEEEDEAMINMNKTYYFLLLVFLSFQLSAQTKEVKYLSGTDNRSTIDWDFFCTGGRNSGYWTKIAVPSQWEQKGFGSYNYGRDYKTYGKNFRFADEKGLYKTTFSVPAAWKNKEVFIVF